MNATFLLRLYPRAWRARYEREFRAMLEDHPVSAAEALDILLGAADAHLRPPSQPATAPPAPPPDPRQAARRRERVQALFFAHLSLFVAVLSILALVNAFFTPGNWWVLYPLWAWGTVLATHAGAVYQWRGLLGAHLALSTGLTLGLVAINIDQGGGPWAIWPALALGIVLATHALIAFRVISLLQAHAVATVLAIGVLALVLAVNGFDNLFSALTWAAYPGLLLAAHWLVRHRGWTLLRAHALAYGVALTLLLIDNLATDPGDLWVRYPFAMWTVLLVGHAVIQLRRARWSGSEWETLMLEDLGARGEPDRQRRLVSTLWVHVYIFLAAATGFVLLDLIGGEGTWAAWPIGVWYALIAIHAGYVLSPRRVLGSLLFGWAAVSAGLIAIDWLASGGTWWYWPVMWSGVAVALLAGAIWTRGRPWVGMHVLGGLALAVALVLTDVVTGPPAWWFYPVAAIVVSWVVHFFATMDLPRMLGQSPGGER